MRRSGVLLAVLLLAAACEPDSVRPGSVPSSGAPSSPDVAIDPWSSYGSGWSTLPSPPEQRSGESWIWIGDEVLVVGGCHADVEDECRETRRSFAFDPAAHSWHRARPAPEPMAGAEAVWVDDEAIFLETYPAEPGPIVGQAYAPSTGTWRSIAPAPLERAYGVVSVWTGEELMLWGGGERGDDRTLEGAAYDPTIDTWHRIADAPIGLNLAEGVWTGSEILVFGSLLSGANRAPIPTSVGAAYDPVTNSWKELPPSALSPQATSAVWLGDRLVAWDYEVHSQEYDPAGDRWSAPMRMPLSFSECYPQSVVVARLLFAWFCGHAALYDEGADGWERIEGGPLDETIYSEAYQRDLQVWRFADLVLAGSAIVMPMQGLTLNRRGTACFGCEDSPVSFWIYRPPPEIVPAPSPEVQRTTWAVRRVARDFLNAWIFRADGRLAWLADAGGIASFRAEVPGFSLPSGFAVHRVEPLESGRFDVAVELGIRDEDHRGPQAILREISLVIGPGVSVGGESAPLLVLSVRG